MYAFRQFLTSEFLYLVMKIFNHIFILNFGQNKAEKVLRSNELSAEEMTDFFKFEEQF